MFGNVSRHLKSAWEPSSTSMWTYLGTRIHHQRAKLWNNFHWFSWFLLDHKFQLGEPFASCLEKFWKQKRKLSHIFAFWRCIREPKWVHTEVLDGSQWHALLRCPDTFPNIYFRNKKFRFFSRKIRDFRCLDMGAFGGILRFMRLQSGLYGSGEVAIATKMCAKV